MDKTVVAGPAHPQGLIPVRFFFQNAESKRLLRPFAYVQKRTKIEPEHSHEIHVNEFFPTDVVVIEPVDNIKYYEDL